MKPLTIKRDGAELEHVRFVYEKLRETLGNMDTMLPHEVLASEKCCEIFLNATMQLYITVGRDILGISTNDMVDYLKIVLENSGDETDSRDLLN